MKKTKLFSLLLACVLMLVALSACGGNSEFNMPKGDTTVSYTHLSTYTIWYSMLHLLSAFHKVMINCNDIVPVSYTHLDVYKRQPRSCVRIM